MKETSHIKLIGSFYGRYLVYYDSGIYNDSIIGCMHGLLCNNFFVGKEYDLNTVKDMIIGKTINKRFTFETIKHKN